MRSQMTIGAQLCILLSLLIIGACVHKPDTFSIDIVHNKEDVYFEQSVFSKGPYKYKMGNPDWKDHHRTFKFSFELDDISSLYYAYLSIESWDVGSFHPIFLNDKEIGYLRKSISIESEKTGKQLYLPK